MHNLVLMVLFEVGKLNAVMAAWQEAGAPAITILDSVGSREMDEHGRGDDLPLMPTIKDLLRGDESPRKTMFSVVEDGAVDPIIEATESLLGDLTQPRKGILVVLPLARVVGYRKP